MSKRLDWIDQARGLSIFLVVYGHNFPVNEPYIYSFHVPLFFLISGMFHPSSINLALVKKRAKMILIPYFFWAFALYLFWFFFGRKYGNSSNLDLSPIDNFIGIFYAQGGQTYMDWGIPLWFLPCIFLVYVFYGLLQRIPSKIARLVSFLLIFIIGFSWVKTTNTHLPWSVDVAFVAMLFYSIGNLLKEWVAKISNKKAILFMIGFFVVNVITFYYNPLKIDMYRSIYGNELLFLISGISGSLAFILLFKLVPIFKFFSYLGKHTIIILATHLRMLTLIKLVFYLVLGMTVFEFNEWQKIGLSVLQIVLLVPIIWLVNKYTPILDGKISKN
jgi:fucose 4-O-acetylase-like acetyltransferase